MTLIVGVLLTFMVLGCIANTKSLVAIIALAALFYVSLPTFTGLLMILGFYFYRTH